MRYTFLLSALAAQQATASRYPVLPRGSLVFRNDTTPSASGTLSEPVSMTTSTIFTTSIHTITDCGPEVPDCPAHSTKLVTETIPISTTVCPISSTPGSDPTDTPAPGASDSVPTPGTPTSPIGTPGTTPGTPGTPGASDSSELPTTFTSGQLTTSTIFSTTTHTVTSCAPDVPDCPADSTVLVTETIPVSTTICPVTELPSATEPTDGEPSETDPSGTGPSNTEPTGTQPSATEPSGTGPTGTESTPGTPGTPTSPIGSGTPGPSDSSELPTTFTSGQLTTSTIFSTTTHTVTSCAPDVPDCPADSTVLVTETIPVSTTICPVTELPSATEPTDDEPSGTEPSGTGPTGTEPSETEPSGTGPTGTEPSETEPSGTGPTETGPTESGTEPTETEPSGTGPTGTEPSETEPSGTGPTTPGESGSTTVTESIINPSTLPPESLTTSTIFSTTTHTVTSCAPDVPDCPADSTVIVTETIPVSTTICPITESLSETEPATDSSALPTGSEPATGPAPTTEPGSPTETAPSTGTDVTSPIGSSTVPGETSPSTGTDVTSPIGSSTAPGETTPSGSNSEPGSPTTSPSGSNVVTQSIVNPSTLPPESLTTSTIFSTSTRTITHCGPEVPDCPADSTEIVTETIPVSTTICPITTTDENEEPGSTPASEPSNPHTTLPPESLTTSTIFSTSTRTVTKCDEEVPDCPAGSTTVITETIPVSTTICPITSTDENEEPGSTAPEPTGTEPAGPEPTTKTDSSPEEPTSGSPPDDEPHTTNPDVTSPIGSTTFTQTNVQPTSKDATEPPVTESLTTSTIFSTTIRTVTDCGPEHPDCTTSTTRTVTETIPVSTTVCPITSTHVPEEPGSTEPGNPAETSGNESPEEPTRSGSPPPDHTEPANTEPITTTRTSTSTIFSTSLHTTDCVLGSPECPDRSTIVVTHTIPISTTLCPITETVVPPPQTSQDSPGDVPSEPSATVTGPPGSAPTTIPGGNPPYLTATISAPCSYGSPGCPYPGSTLVPTASMPGNYSASKPPTVPIAAAGRFDYALKTVVTVALLVVVMI